MLPECKSKVNQRNTNKSGFSRDPIKCLKVKLWYTTQILITIADPSKDSIADPTKSTSWNSATAGFFVAFSDGKTAPSLITMSCKHCLLAQVSMTQTEIRTHVTDKECTLYIINYNYIYMYIYTHYTSLQFPTHNSTNGYWCKLIMANIHVVENSKRIECKWECQAMTITHKYCFQRFNIICGLLMFDSMPSQPPS